MPRLPVLSGAKLIKILSQLGYSIRSRSGSHVTLIHPQKRPVTVVVTKELSIGVLKNALKIAGIERNELERILKEL